jgi:hypothetical protein
MKPLPWRAESSRPGVSDRLTVLARPIRNPAPPLILLAQSARALAQGARAAGFTPLVIDRFADADTQAAAAECYRIPVTRDGALDPASVLTAVTELRVRHPAAELLWGGGLESQPVLLEHLYGGVVTLPRVCCTIARHCAPHALRSASRCQPNRRLPARVAGSASAPGRREDGT